MGGRRTEGEEGGSGSRPPQDRTYVNHMRLAVSLSEVQIDLGQVSPGEEDAAVVGRFVTSPDYLLGMRSRISGAIELYQSTFGTIVDGGLGGEHKVTGRG
jgi:hypothetical protein